MQTSPLARRELSRFILIDMQERLAATMPADAMPAVIRNCSILLQAARLLEVPVLYTEQYPQGLGHTLPELGELLSLPTPSSVSRHAAAGCITKTAFSACEEPAFNSQLTGDRPQLILAGMEAHICVLQTALQLQSASTGPHPKQVLVVEDAVISRNPANKANALARLRDAGVIVATTESIVFEWLGAAEGDMFKQISKLIR